MSKSIVVVLCIFLFIPIIKANITPSQNDKSEPSVNSGDEIAQLLASAELGDANAMFRLGYIYFYGDGVTEDVNTGVEWYRKASKAGHTDAMYDIGLMYETGKGLNKDYEKSKEWYKKASELGVVKAKEKLIIIFFKKFGYFFLGGYLAIIIVGGVIYGSKEKPEGDDVNRFIVETEPPKWSVWLIVRRYIGALLMYPLYWLTLWGSITRVVGPTLSYENAKELVKKGAIESIWDYGWGNHYIWFLITFCLVTFCCSALVGAIVKKKGAVVASFTNLIVIIFTLIFCYILYALPIELENQIAWKIVSPLSVIGSVFFAFLGGAYGQHLQQEEFPDNTIFGIHPLHWLWIWILSGIYVQCLASALVKLVTYVNLTNTTTFLDAIPFLFFVLPILAYGFPVFLMYGILTKKILIETNVIIKILAFIGIYIGGIIVGVVVEFICNWILNFIFNLF